MAGLAVYLLDTNIFLELLLEQEESGLSPFSSYQYISG